MAQFTTHHTLPPFPDDITTAPLVSVSLAKLEAGDSAESDAFYKACQGLGFFYLQMDGSPLGEEIVKEAEQLHALQKVFFERPKSEKDKFGRDIIDPFFAYRWAPMMWTDVDGQPKRNESYNVSGHIIRPVETRCRAHNRSARTTWLATASASHATKLSAIISLSSSNTFEIAAPPST